jgi:hypothetical protein
MLFLPALLFKMNIATIIRNTANVNTLSLPEGVAFPKRPSLPSEVAELGIG